MDDVKLYGSDERKIDLSCADRLHNDVGIDFRINKCAVFVVM